MKPNVAFFCRIAAIVSIWVLSCLFLVVLLRGGE